MASAGVTTLCWKSWAGDARPIFLPSETCNNPVAPCSVHNMEHQGHNWLPPSLLYVKPQWRHCNGVPLHGERLVGA